MASTPSSRRSTHCSRTPARWARPHRGHRTRHRRKRCAATASRSISQPEKYVARNREGVPGRDDRRKFEILLARAENAREVLATELTRLGAIVDEAIAYRTVPETEDVAGGIARFREEGADWITFTSFVHGGKFRGAQAPAPRAAQDGEQRPDHVGDDASARARRGRRGRGPRHPRPRRGDPESRGEMTPHRRERFFSSAVR